MRRSGRKKPRPLTVGSIALRFVDGEPSKEIFKNIMQLATRGDLKLLELRCAVYLCLIADSASAGITTVAIGRELGYSNNLSCVTRALAAIKKLGIASNVKEQGRAIYSMQPVTPLTPLDLTRQIRAHRDAPLLQVRTQWVRTRAHRPPKVVDIDEALSSPDVSEILDL